MLHFAQQATDKMTTESYFLPVIISPALHNNDNFFSVFSASWILHGTHVTTIVKYLHTPTQQFCLKISIHQNHNRTSKKYGNKFLKRSALPKALSKVNLPQFCIHTVKKKSRLENKSLNPTFKLKKLL